MLKISVSKPGALRHIPVNNLCSEDELIQVGRIFRIGLRHVLDHAERHFRQRYPWVRSLVQRKQ